MTERAFDEELGKRLAEHRKRIGISQEFLANILRRDQTFVSKIETGKRTISVYELSRWGKSLNLTPAEMSDLIPNMNGDA